MAAECPTDYFDVMLDPNRSVEGADAPEDQSLGRRTLATKGHKKTQVLKALGVIVILMGPVCSTAKLNGVQPAKESEAFSRWSSTVPRSDRTLARNAQFSSLDWVSS